MKARLTAAGLIHGTADPDSPAPRAAVAAGAAGEPASARVAEARSRASERRRRQRHVLRPLGWAFIVVVVVTSQQGQPAPGLSGMRLAVTAAVVFYAVAVAVGLRVDWAERGPGAQALVAGLIGAGGVALAALQSHGAAGFAAALGVWIAAVRLPDRLAVAVAGVITITLGIAIGLAQRSPAQAAIAALLCLLLAVTGRFIRVGRESQDQTELLLAQLRDAREAEAAAVALAERGRIAGELHDVLAHSLSGLAIQLQGARKLADAEPVSQALRDAIGRSAELARGGLMDARQAVSALRGDRLPTVGELAALVADFRRDTGTDVSLTIEGTPRPLSAEANLALYRGAQEALTNIVRYAPGATAAITVRYDPEHTILSVANGPRPPGGNTGGAAGEEPDMLAGAGGGHGLHSMRERAQRAGGTARAGPDAGGWLVELEVPALWPPRSPASGFSSPMISEWSATVSAC